MAAYIFCASAALAASSALAKALSVPIACSSSTTGLAVVSPMLRRLRAHCILLSLTVPHLVLWTLLLPWTGGMPRLPLFLKSPTRPSAHALVTHCFLQVACVSGALELVSDDPLSKQSSAHHSHLAHQQSVKVPIPQFS